MSIDPAVSLRHPESKGVNPGLAVIGAVVLSVVLVAITYFTFNRSASATSARQLSVRHYEQRKERSAATADATGGSAVTNQDVVKLIDQIDQAQRNVDQGSNQLQPDDLSDKALGLN